ncbi:hypothetical protein Goshw_024852 [Gossypium schwendimanii]|uniref:Uncharacterized protein n=1 Tax=Gossypium schwendimanii TaxID=34291 RepID=A0A7J9LBU7_GOSSC|nr:hypothetical protein [Gossypium schwendimanii]
MALSTRIEELEGELALYGVAMGKGVSSATFRWKLFLCQRHRG